MATDKKRLDETFQWPSNAEVLKSLREFTRAVEARLAPLDAQSQNYQTVVEQVRQIAIARLNEVLLPAYEELSALIDAGIPSTKILDSGSFGRSLLGTVSRPALMTLLNLKVAELDLNGGTFTSPHLVSATATTPGVEAAGLEILTAKWMRDLLGVLNYAPQGSMASFTSGARALAPAIADRSDRVPNTTWVGTVVANAITALVNGSPAALDTLEELANALGDDPNFAATTATALGNRVRFDAGQTISAAQRLQARNNLGIGEGDSPAFNAPTAATAAAGTNTTQLATTAFVEAIRVALVNALAPKASPALTGTPTVPTAAAGTNTTQVASTAFVAALGALKANLASPAFTGTPTAPTPAAGTNTTQIATSAFVQAAVSAAIASLVNSSPAALDTLQELATALGNDPNFATTINTALGNRLRVDAAQGLAAANQLTGMSNLGIQDWARTMLRQADALAGREQMGLGTGQNVTHRDIRANRGDGQGAFYFGDGDIYIYWDGGKFHVNRNLEGYGTGRFRGDLFTKGRLIVGEDAVVSFIEMRHTNGQRYVYAEGGVVGFLSSSAGWTFQSLNNGDIWTPAFGNLSERIYPVGCAAMFFHNNIPTGWLKCNGAQISRTAYGALFNAIGTNFGAGNGTTTFNLPDTRGEFIRSWDDGRGVDPGRGLGSWQAENLGDHWHTTPFGMDPSTGQLTAWIGGGGGVFTGHDAVANAGANVWNTDFFQGRTIYNARTANRNAPTTETRPRNVALVMCIKY